MPHVPPVPLAWKNLTHDRVRFALFASGIAFAVVLMAVQLGIMHAMLDANTIIFSSLNTDLVLVNPSRPSLLFRQSFDRRRLNQSLGTPGVASAHAVYVEHDLGRLRNTDQNPETRGRTRRLRVIGVDPASRAFDFPNLDPGSWEKLQTPDAALYDRHSRPALSPGSPGETVYGRLEPGLRTELSGRQITLVGGFDLGFDFGTDGTIVLSDRTFARILREPYTLGDPLADVDLGIVRLKPGADPLVVQKQLQEAIGRQGDVRVLTKAEAISHERNFWWTSTPIGFAFGAGVVLGFVVGTVICYQILSSDVADHFAEYATLKAIGYPNRYLSFVVIQESLILALAGFVPGIVVTFGAYAFLTNLSSMPLVLTPGRAGLVFALTVVMCVLSGFFALSKVKNVDPADVF
jgi:putative ABC transport system permease protein